MSIKEYFYDAVPSEFLKLNLNEAAQRLKVSHGFTNELIEKCEKALKEVIQCKYCAIKTDVQLKEDNVVSLGFAEFKSKDLAKNLNSSSEAYVMAVTLGSGVDRLLQKLSVTSVSEHFITDALASAYAETSADYTEKAIKSTQVCTPRFSPGYGDLPLSIQPTVLEALNARKLININMNKSLLMIPSKSITAIMGIRK